MSTSPVLGEESLRQSDKDLQIVLSTQLIMGGQFGVVRSAKEVCKHKALLKPINRVNR